MPVRIMSSLQQKSHTQGSFGEWNRISDDDNGTLEYTSRSQSCDGTSDDERLRRRRSSANGRSDLKKNHYRNENPFYVEQGV